MTIVQENKLLDNRISQEVSTSRPGHPRLFLLKTIIAFKTSYWEMRSETVFLAHTNAIIVVLHIRRAWNNLSPSSHIFLRALVLRVLHFAHLHLKSRTNHRKIIKSKLALTENVAQDLISRISKADFFISNVFRGKTSTDNNSVRVKRLAQSFELPSNTW